MKKTAVFFLFFLYAASLNAEIPMDEFSITDTAAGFRFGLGTQFGKVMEVYSDLKEKGLHPYSNMTYREYERNGIIISINHRHEIPEKGYVLVIDISSTGYSTGRGISIGSTKDEVISAYGPADDVDKIYGGIHPPNKLYYINSEYDHMEMIFTFNGDDKVVNISMANGDIKTEISREAIFV
jgi:hypothetical protein